MAAAFDLAWIIAVVLVGIGLYALVRPGDLARRYGVPIEKDKHETAKDRHEESDERRQEAAYVRATGTRDIAIGVLLAATAYFRNVPLLIVFAVVGIVVSIVDLGIVHRHGDPPHHTAHAIHGSGIIAFILILSMALFAIGR
jgi:Domain of unknown function (DUF4267)